MAGNVRNGVRPAPTSLKLLKGETKRDRINRNEPQAPAPAEPPAAPDWLDDDAKAVWANLVPQLHAKGLFTAWDLEVFAVFCEAVVHHRKACELVDNSAILLKGAHGAMAKNPALQIVRDSAQVIRAYAQEFGLSPSARSGIELPAQVEFEDARRLLS